MSCGCFRKPGRKFRLRRHDPGWVGADEFKELRKDELKGRAVELLQKNIADLEAAQELLYASDVHSVLIVLQAMDAAGKDYMKALPERGRIGIFNRSYYEDVLIVRVHPEILTHQKLPPGDRGDRFWNARCDDINRLSDTARETGRSC
jgi:polyphosphate kinase 2 (PPK2 family)